MSHRSLSPRVVTWLLLAIAILIPCGVAVVQHPTTIEPQPVTAPEGVRFPPSTLPLSRMPIGKQADVPPRVTHVQVCDFDRDGRGDVLVCDAVRNAVLWQRQSADGQWEERILGEDLVAPAHATVIDLDRDGDNDVLASVLGNIYPDDSHVGRVVWLEQTSSGFTPHLLLDDVRRVADVQGGDLDGDGDVDLAVVVFGYACGEILWLENDGDSHLKNTWCTSCPVGSMFRSPISMVTATGPVHCDFAERRRDLGLRESGGRKVRTRRVHFTVNFDIGVPVRRCRSGSGWRHRPAVAARRQLRIRIHLIRSHITVASGWRMKGAGSFRPGESPILAAAMRLP
ncbi:MAG: VCBS repeat-containing protein [Planctomycetaceae bacterium]